MCLTAGVQVVWIVPTLQGCLEDLWRMGRGIFGGKVEESQASLEFQEWDKILHGAWLAMCVLLFLGSYWTHSPMVAGAHPVPAIFEDF